MESAELLPAYWLELSRVKAVFKPVRHHDTPVRSYTTKADRRRAVEAGLDALRQRLGKESKRQKRLAA